MRILFSHPNYPSQFRRLAPSLAAAGHEVVFLHRHVEWHATTPEHGLKLVRYGSDGDTAPVGPALHPYLERLEGAVLEGQACFRAALQLREQGFIPDVVISHAGFGNGLYLADAFPQAKRIGLFEWFYNAYGSDVEFLCNGVVETDRKLRLRTWNAAILLELAQCHVAVTPTEWQRRQFPRPWRKRMKVIHEGIDVNALSKIRRQPTTWPDCLPPNQETVEVVTYVSRGFERYRCFPEAMLALAELQRRRPKAHVLIAGSDVVCYGGGTPKGFDSWGAWAKQQAGLDPSRTHWLGALKTAEYHNLLALSQAHLYLTAPFVLSWSMLEAMASGCPISASNTEPVLEVCSHKEEGLLANPRDPMAVASNLEQLLERPELAWHLGEQAQQRAAHFSAERGLKQWSRVVDGI